jgi:hypothetical protein
MSLRALSKGNNGLMYQDKHIQHRFVSDARGKHIKMIGNEEIP